MRAELATIVLLLFSISSSFIPVDARNLDEWGTTTTSAATSGIGVDVKHEPDYDNEPGRDVSKVLNKVGIQKEKKTTYYVRGTSAGSTGGKSKSMIKFRRMIDENGQQPQNQQQHHQQQPPHTTIQHQRKNQEEQNDDGNYSNNNNDNKPYSFWDISTWGWATWLVLGIVISIFGLISCCVCFCCCCAAIF